MGAEPISELMIQFLDWIATRPRTYADVMDVWRTSCPRLSIWEDALLARFIEINDGGPNRQREVVLTPQGRAILNEGHKGGRSRDPFMT